MPISVSDLFSPMTTTTFLREVWGGRPHVISRSDARFAALLPWDTLNDLLATNRLDYGRFRLTKGGRPLPAEAFLTHERTRTGAPITRIDVAGLHGAVEEGATLILDGADELVPAIGALATALERILGEYVRAHVFAGWHHSQGLATHWDDHDVLMLQIHGAKDWQVYEPTREHPMQRDVEFCELPEGTKPCLKVRVEPGDFLYIPRGWWHDATPCGMPTLHVSFSVKKRTGIDYLESLVEALCDDPFLRADVPRFAPEGRRAEYMEQLRTRVLAAVDGLPLDQYLRGQDARAALGRRPSLPWPGLAEAACALPNSTTLTPQLRRAVELQRDEDGITLAAGGRQLTLGEEAEPVLAFLTSCEPCTVAGLLAKTGAAGLSDDDVRGLLNQLICLGVVTATMT